MEFRGAATGDAELLLLHPVDRILFCREAQCDRIGKRQIAGPAWFEVAGGWTVADNPYVPDRTLFDRGLKKFITHAIGVF